MPTTMKAPLPKKPAPHGFAQPCAPQVCRKTADFSRPRFGSGAFPRNPGSGSHGALRRPQQLVERAELDPRAALRLAGALLGGVDGLPARVADDLDAALGEQRVDALGAGVGRLEQPPLVQVLDDQVGRLLAV